MYLVTPSENITFGAIFNSPNILFLFLFLVWFVFIFSLAFDYYLLSHQAKGTRKKHKKKLSQEKKYPKKMQPTITIRLRRPSDLPSCASLLAQVYEKDKYPVQGVSRAEDFLSSPNTLCAWVAVSAPARISTAETKDENTTTSSAADSPTQESHQEDRPDEIIGHIALSLSPSDPAVSLHRSLHPHSNTPLAVLERLFVSPSARGRGVAEVLMRAVSAEAARRGVRVVLFALVKDEGAMRLYQRVGWREFARTGYEYQDGEGRGREMEAVCFVGPESVSEAEVS